MASSLVDLINDSVKRRADLLALGRFVKGDQWLNGAGWTGPQPLEEVRVAQGSSTISQLIRRVFVQKNLLFDVADRHRDGILGKPPEYLVNNAEAQSALEKWWEKNAIKSVFEDALLTLLYAQEGSTEQEDVRKAYSPLRVFIREASLVEVLGEDGQPTGEFEIPRRSTLEEALKDILVCHVPPYNAGIVRDRDGQPVASYYIYDADITDNDDSLVVEITGRRADLERYGLDIAEEGDPDDTIIQVRTWVGDTPGNLIGEAEWELGTPRLMYEMERDAFISVGMISEQKLLNKAWTMLSHHMDNSGFPERLALNAMPPGKFYDEAGNEDPTGTIFKQETYRTGAGVTNFLTGIPRENERREVIGYETPSFIRLDPGGAEFYRETIELAREAIYESARQLHVLISGDATASGRSRESAMNDFVTSLAVTKEQIDSAIEWTLATVLNVAAILQDSPGLYSSVEVNAEAMLNISIGTSDSVEEGDENEIEEDRSSPAGLRGNSETE